MNDLAHRLAEPPTQLLAVRPVRRLAWLWMAAWLVIAAVPLVAQPARGAAALDAPEGEWLRVETPHFTLFSGTDAATARRVGGDLETLRAALAVWLDGQEVHSPLPTTIYVFPDDRTFLPYKQGVRGDARGVAGYFVSHPLGNYVALDGSPRADPSRILYHEYLHYFVANNLPGVPLWFNEGLAELYSSFEARGETVQLGKPLAHHRQWLRRHRQISLEQLFAVGVESSEYNETARRGGFYAQSWALVHYLMVGDPMVGDEGRGAQLIRFLELLVGGADTDTAFAEAFDIDYRQLERELEAYVRRPELPVLTLSVAGLGEDVPTRVEPLPRAELLYRLGDLLAHAAPERLDQARAHFDAALELAPRHAPAWAGLGYLEDLAQSYDDARGYYERALELAPGDFRVHYLYGRNLIEPWTGRRLTASELRGAAAEQIAAARRAFERSVELNPDFPEAWVGLGATWALEQKPSKQGLAALERARRLLPSRADVVFNLAVTYARVGKRQRALELIEGDLARLGEPGMVEAAREAVLRAEIERADELLRAGEEEAALALLEHVAQSTTDPLWRLDLERQLANLESTLRRNRQVDRYNQAVDLVHRGQESEAIEALEELLDGSPEPDLARMAEDLLARLRVRNRR